MIFPKWSNRVTPILLANAFLFLVVTVFIFWYWFGSYNLDVGYMPEQPIKYSHKIHVGELGIDCRYCHYAVEKSSTAAIPPTEVCMNCHKLVKNKPGTTEPSKEIAKVVKSYEKNEKIDWVKVNNLPDYSYFNHSRHVVAGVSCVECHGRVDQMDVVFKAEPLSMGSCLECHRNPVGKVRPAEFVTELGWKAEDNGLDGEALSKHLIEVNKISPRVDCNTCHR